MTCTVCPNCGIDLERYGTIERGNLVLSPHEARWKGKPVKLRQTGRIIVSALARADGVPVPFHVLADVIGSESEDPRNLLHVQLAHLRKGFREADPTFAAIENVWGVGVRWAA